MELEPQQKTDDGRTHLPERSGGGTSSAESVNELFREWKAEHTAFGLVLVAYAFLLSVAPLIARHPDELMQIACISLRHIVDWRAWVLTASVACLVAIAVIALKRRR